MNFSYQINPNGARSGRVVIEGREVFFDNVPPDASRDPLAHVAAQHYLATGATSGTVTVTAG